MGVSDNELCSSLLLRIGPVVETSVDSDGLISKRCEARSLSRPADREFRDLFDSMSLVVYGLVFVTTWLFIERSPMVR